MEEEHLSKKERRKLIKEQRRLERGDQQSKKKIKSIFIYSMLFIIIACSGFFLFKGNKYIAPTADGDPFIGDVTAPLEIIEFGDFQCPFTKQFNEDILPKLLEEYKGKIKIVYRDMITNRHLNSDISAEAAQCAAEQGKFKEYHDILFSRQGAASKINLKNYAQQVGLDTNQFDECFDSGKYKDEVRQDTKDGKISKVSVTPTIFINNNVMNGVFDLADYRRIIDEELAK